eukprot:scaffold11903_cov67-Phaeocystis_antarctica.AAC.3
MAARHEAEMTSRLGEARFEREPSGTTTVGEPLPHECDQSWGRSRPGPGDACLGIGQASREGKHGCVVTSNGCRVSAVLGLGLGHRGICAL